MRLLSQPSDLLFKERKVCAAIGMFDGVHLGHQQVLRQTVSDARQHNALAVAVTFDRHPNSVVAPERTPRLIYTLSQKLRALEDLGMDAVLLLEFSPEFSRKPGEQFVRDLVAGFGQVHSICVGSSFNFGFKRTGNVELLKRMGAELNFVVHGLAAVSLGGRIVSSTRIRELIALGNLDQAGQCLGRPYCLAGVVEQGNQRGRKLGFPTANLEVTGLVVPPHGVYAIRAQIKGRTVPGVTNIGVRPTLETPQPALHVETHLFDFREELYGQELEICFVERIRGEQKFPSLDELKAQIQLDAVQARRILS